MIVKRNKTLIWLLIVACCVGGGILLRSKSSQARASSASNVARKDETPFERLNKKSWAAKENDPQSIDQLADGVISDFVLILPSDAKESLKSRLARAELNYRQRGQGISEANVVRTINKLADDFGAPEYAKTSPYQVRYLRVSMMGILPNLVARDAVDSNKRQKKVGSSINSKMSPIEAAFITALMLQQKVVNEDYQVEPKEWRNHLYQKNQEMWRNFRDNKDSLSKPSGPELFARPHNPKREEMKRVLARGIANMSSSARANLAAKILDDLGITNKEKQQ